VKKLIISLALALLSINSFGFEILALGTSNTNCKNAGQAFTSSLNDLLGQEKINATVINAGVDGDKPTFMQARLEQSIKAIPNIKIVIFEPGPNEKNK
jgi:ABC-type glycerol-3-phosphate transport system substrate-binding protein